jgi:hypothetical protein
LKKEKNFPKFFPSFKRDHPHNAWHHARPYLGSKPNNHNKGTQTAQWKQSPPHFTLGILHKVALTL